jgi:hypothetical protein
VPTLLRILAVHSHSGLPSSLTFSDCCTPAAEEGTHISSATGRYQSCLQLRGCLNIEETRMMPHGAINRDSALTKLGDGEPSHLSRPDLISRKLPPPFGVASSRGPISPPPLKRNSFSAPPAPLDPCTSEVNSETAGDWAPQALPDRASLPLADRVAEHAPEAPKQSGDASNTRLASNMTPPSATTPSRERHQELEVVRTPTARTVPITEWTVQKLANRLRTFNQEVRSDHSQLVAHAIESAKCREWRTHHGLDLFRNLQPHPNPEVKGKQIKIRFKVSYSALFYPISVITFINSSLYSTIKIRRIIVIYVIMWFALRLTRTLSHPIGSIMWKSRRMS